MEAGRGLVRGYGPLGWGAGWYAGYGPLGWGAGWYAGYGPLAYGEPAEGARYGAPPYGVP